MVTINLPNDMSLDEIKDIISFSENAQIKTKAKAIGVSVGAVALTILGQWKLEETTVMPPVLHSIVWALIALSEGLEGAVKGIKAAEKNTKAATVAAKQTSVIGQFERAGDILTEVFG